MSSPTHLPRCLRDACSLWLDSQHHPPSSAPSDGTAPTVGERVKRAGTTDHGGQHNQARLKGQGEEEEEEQGGEHGGEKERRRRRLWRPLVLASPSDTNYAGYGPGDVAIVEPPHRGDSDRGLGDGTTGAGYGGGRDSAPIPVSPADSADGKGDEVVDGALVARDLLGAEETTIPLLLLHDLVALALRVGKSSDQGFRKELQELLRRYVDMN